MEFDLSANKANVDESIDPNSKSCAFDIFYYWLVCATFVSLVDGFATLFLGKKKSLSSILLFSTNQGQNRQKSYRGPLNYIFNKSDLTSGLSEKNNEDVLFFLRNEVQYIPEANFTSLELSRIRKNVTDWNLKQIDQNYHIILGTGETVIKGTTWCCLPYSHPFKEWNDQANFESRGPVTGVRIWKTRFAIYGLQFKYGETWAEKRERATEVPCCCCFCPMSVERNIRIDEMELESDEWISQVKTKTDIFTNRLMRIEITTTLGRIFDSHEGIVKWDPENWPHSQLVKDRDSKILAFCSGLDEEDGGGLGRLLNFHWIEL